MPSNIQADTSWDFTPVYALIQSLSEKGRDSVDGGDATPSPHAKRRAFADDGGVGLGDFNNVWDYLGVSRDKPTPSVPTFESATAKKDKYGDAYASDGAAYYNQSSKSVRWRDETDGGDIADTQAEDTSLSGLENEGLTKNQRKKRNRKIRKKAELEELAANLARKKNAGPVESGDESDVSPQAIRILSPASRARFHAHNNSMSGSYPPIKPPKDLPPKFSHATLSDNSFRPMQVAPAKRPPTKTPSQPNDGHLSAQISAAVDKVAATMKKAPETPQRPMPQTLHNSLLATHAGVTTKAFHPQPDPFNSVRPAANKNSVKNPFQSALANPMSVADQLNKKLESTPTKSRQANDILPLVHRTSSDRNWSLLLKLLNQFPENRDTLLSPLQLSYNRPVPYGIHVFVDASNILIGFMDHLKRARNIPEHARVPRVYPSFHALALLLERRRPVAKRVLAGSTPHVPAFDEAKEIGYDCSILDKVWKARELTERQRRFAVKAASGGRPQSGHGSDSGGNGGVSDTVPHHQQPKWVEQGVDEVLHLKILESILDVPTASHDSSKAGSCERPTMVLATGDAAEAEYSSGFRKMVERALTHGWNVEVMAWGASINHDWRKMEKKSEWQSRFRIIELDSYVEELFSDADAA
ncbi:hypothetical protein FH972_023068 [Carpinus fangiana]|uniref:NYN domain-containing protein n=1 Tax=Carpinus fangiana TaxID=176857 RepID=A0A5N6KU31_9ROSI|nr:hypothetical protein FH972_023068 [Carpinus fangiana]